MTEQELKKCPACGGEARYIGKQVMCCKCSYTIFEHGSTEAAIKAWNNQPRIEELKQSNKELADNLEEAKELQFLHLLQTLQVNAEWKNEVAPKISELKQRNKELVEENRTLTEMRSETEDTIIEQQEEILLFKELLRECLPTISYTADICDKVAELEKKIRKAVSDD